MAKEMVVSAKTEMEITPTHTYTCTHHTTLTTAISARLNCVRIVIFFTDSDNCTVTFFSCYKLYQKIHCCQNKIFFPRLFVTYFLCYSRYDFSPRFFPHKEPISSSILLKFSLGAKHGIRTGYLL